MVVIQISKTLRIRFPAYNGCSVLTRIAIGQVVAFGEFEPFIFEQSELSAHVQKKLNDLMKKLKEEYHKKNLQLPLF